MFHKGVSRKIILKKFKGNFRCLKGIQESFKGVSRKFEECFNGVLSGFQVYMKEVQGVFERSFTDF